MEERTFETVTDRCSIVDAPDRHVVGIRTVFGAESRANVFRVAAKYIGSGTVGLVGRALGVPPAGPYVGVATDITGPGRLAYTVGVETAGPAALPEGLPEDVAACVCPGGRFAKLTGFEGQMPAYDYFVTTFRSQTAYVPDPDRVPCHVYGCDGALLAIYEPVKMARDEHDRFGSIRWQVVSLPPVRFAGVKRDAAVGDDVIGLYFAVQSQVLDLPCAANYRHEYLGFPYTAEDRQYACFGSQVDGFEGVPAGIDTLTLPGGLFVRISSYEMNGDDPAALYAALDWVCARISACYERDHERNEIVRFHLGTSAALYVPIAPR